MTYLTTAKPILNQLKSNNLVNTATYVVRVFGGTLLGISGLIDSYSNAALISIDNSKGTLWYQRKNISIRFPYEYKGIIESTIKEFSASIKQQDFSEDISMMISINEEYINQFKSKIKELSSGKIEPLIH